MKHKHFILVKEYATLSRIEFVKGFKDKVLAEAKRMVDDECESVQVWEVDKSVMIIPECPVPEEHIFVKEYRK